jgi:hypothetical protein
MNKMQVLTKPFTVLISILLPMVGLTALASESSNPIPPTQISGIEPENPVQVAQGLIGECRAAKKRIFVYTARSASSRTIRTLAPNENVTLAGNGNGGWIAISAPETGYVQTMDLKLCQEATQPDSDSTSNICRRVTVPQGLVIRQNPNPSASRVDSVFEGNTVKLAVPKQSQIDSQGRTWIQITEPMAGWVSSGFPQGNLSPELDCQ